MNFNVNKFIENHSITDLNKVRIAMSMPVNVPTSFLRPLEPIGITKFKGDNYPENMKNLSLNGHFVKGQTYPVYEGENGEFTVSIKTGVGMTLNSKAWTKVLYFD